MNERIKELASQVLDELVPETWVALGYDKIKEIQFRTAELIVRECAELVDNKEMITAAQTYDEVFVAKYDTKELCAKQIQEHFGVEQ